jgi:hypothetical protein
VEEAVDLVVTTLIFTLTAYGFVQLMARLLTVPMSSNADFHAIENGGLLFFTRFAFISHQTRNFHFPITIANIMSRSWIDKEFGFVVSQRHM